MWLALCSTFLLSHLGLGLAMAYDFLLGFTPVTFVPPQLSQGSETICPWLGIWFMGTRAYPHMVGLHAKCLGNRSSLSPLQSSLGPYGAQLPPVTMRRHCIGLLWRGYLLAGETYTLCSLFTALLASGDGWKWGWQAHRHYTNTVDASYSYSQTVMVQLIKSPNGTILTWWHFLKRLWPIEGK